MRKANARLPRRLSSRQAAIFTPNIQQYFLPRKQMVYYFSGNQLFLTRRRFCPKSANIGLCLIFIASA